MTWQDPDPEPEPEPEMTDSELENQALVMMIEKIAFGLTPFDEL